MDFDSTIWVLNILIQFFNRVTVQDLLAKCVANPPSCRSARELLPALAKAGCGWLPYSISSSSLISNNRQVGSARLFSPFVCVFSLGLSTGTLQRSGLRSALLSSSLQSAVGASNAHIPGAQAWQGLFEQRQNPLRRRPPPQQHKRRLESRSASMCVLPFRWTET
jgi:hypothetical protein